MLCLGYLSYADYLGNTAQVAANGYVENTTEVIQ